jgi:hypothetical protein
VRNLCKWAIEIPISLTDFCKLFITIILLKIKSKFITMKSFNLKSPFNMIVLSQAVFFLVAGGLSACKKNDGALSNPQPVATVVSASGDLTAALTGFRHLIGDSLNAVPGKTSGRREINWDGVPANLTNNDNFPFDFFNSTDANAANGRKRGLVYQNTGTAFRVDSTDFASIDPSYATEFVAFSPKKLFTYLGNNITDLLFKVPGTNTDATVKGFGLIFSDVDDANSTSVEFFNGLQTLGVFKAPVHQAGSSFSFVGVYFPNDKVTRVRITAGNGVLAAGVKDVSQGGSKDLVVMDDFLYSEPLPIQ